MLTTGLGLTVVVVADEVAEHPLALVTLTVNEPDSLSVMDWVVAPLLHNQELPADAVSTTLSFEQKVVLPFAVIVAAGMGFTVTTVAAEVPVQPPAWVTVTVYDPAVLTVIDCVLAPLLHK